MSAARFNISLQNPNDQIGGGGCVCSPTKCSDCTGPYAVFYGCETDSNVSPHVVLSLACAAEFAKRAESEDALATSADVINSTADEVKDFFFVLPSDRADEPAENPSVEDVDLLDALDEDAPEL